MSFAGNDLCLKQPRRVLVVGTGLAAYGACLALLKHKELSITVIDIGLNSPYPNQPNRSIPNAVAYKNQYFTYGLNDERTPFRLVSQRLCSSHAIGGFSKVYSGSLLKPSDADLESWPKRSRPSDQDYNSVLSTLSIWQQHDDLDSVFPCYPFDSPQYDHEKDHTLLGLPRLAITKMPEKDYPFDSSLSFLRWEKEGRITYLNNTFLIKFTAMAKGITVATTSGRLDFDQIYLGAGCINTTSIVDRSLYGFGEREYMIQSAPILLQLSLKIPFISRLMSPLQAPCIRPRNADFCDFFLEHKSKATAHKWSHTQIGQINSTIQDRTLSAFSPKLRPLLVKLFSLFRFSITVFHSKLGSAAYLKSVVSQGEGALESQTVTIIEPEARCLLSMRRSIRDAIYKSFYRLQLLPIPLSHIIADVVRGNRLGGWHFGGTLPMTNRPTKLTELTPDGQLAAAPGVFVIDSSSFPSVPGSTVALLTMANAYRIASHSVPNS